MPAHKRLAAAIALVSGAGALAAATAEAVRDFPRGAIVLACIAVAISLAVYAIARRGAVRAAGLTGAAILLGAAVAVLVGREPLVTIAIAGTAVLSVAAARTAFRARVVLPAAPPPQHAVLFYNPHSGGGKAAHFGVAEAAADRGIKPVELTAGADLETLVRAEVAAGADALAMAGGDGSQAIVAAIAAEAGLPYACVPAGTRNHFALDLGVDRDDVVGALDAFVDGGERVVDLAEVDGRVFVNNVSLGLYATAVQRDGYREAKIRTILDTVPDAAEESALRWHGPDGEEHPAGVVMMVSNNRYRLGTAIGSGTRPGLEAAELGVVVMGPRGAGERRGWREWTEPWVEVDADGDEPIPAGIDGEAVELRPPVTFGVRPAALRVRIARGHPGASPSALQPEGFTESVRALGRIALGLAGPSSDREDEPRRERA